MKHRLLPAIASALLFLGVTSGAGAATSTPSASEVHRGTCTVELSGFGAPTGRGTLVTTSSGRIIFVCNVDVTNPPSNTVVQTFPDTTGDVVVVTVSGHAVVVLTP